MSGARGGFRISLERVKGFEPIVHLLDHWSLRQFGEAPAAPRRQGAAGREQRQSRAPPGGPGPPDGVPAASAHEASELRLEPFAPRGMPAEEEEEEQRPNSYNCFKIAASRQTLWNERQ
eukprot:3139837-Pyramimonas_sp.AAC.1